MSLQDDLFKRLRPFMRQAWTDRTFEEIRSVCSSWLAELPVINREHFKIQYDPSDRRLHLLICDCRLGACHL